MKIQYKNILLALGAGVLMSSCGHRDIFKDLIEPGQQVPVAYWEVGGTAVKAGESFTFQGKYTVEQGKTVDYSEIWYSVNRDETASATVKLAGAGLNYTKTYTSLDTLRSYNPIARFSHSLAQLDDITIDGDENVRHYQYVIRGEVPVSRTLTPVSWSDAAAWDQERFDTYYPQGFAEEFCAEVVDLLTKDATYYSSLRVVYLNYPFTNEQVKAVNAKYSVNLPDNIDMSKGDLGTGEKSDIWKTTDVPSDEAIIGYYYNTMDADGNVVANEIAKDAPTPDESGQMMYNGAYCYPVYVSAPWVFCRYDDNLGAIVNSVRPAYMPAFKELLSLISFPEWIYDSSNQAYKIDFSRKYSLNCQFRVYDTDGEEGIANDVRVISVN